MPQVRSIDEDKKTRRLERQLREAYGVPERVRRGASARRLRYLRRIERVYGLSEASLGFIYDWQGRRCALCLCEGEAPHRPHCWPHGLVIDHCHALNVVRGLLCFRCNLLLGRVEAGLDPRRLDPKWLLRAEAYTARYTR